MDDPSKSVVAKAHKYLESGRICVESVDPPRARAQGSSDSAYAVTCSAGVWTCSCPAQVNWCAHALAVSWILNPSTSTKLGATTEELDALLGLT